MLETFNHFFHTYLYPNQLKHGAKLIGRWVNESQTEITAMWEYESVEHYHSIEKDIQQSELHRAAQEKRKENGHLFLECHEEFLSSTSEKGTYFPPKHIVTVSGYITNEKGEVLLVRNLHRSDTMEMPGGQVEEGERLDDAIHREIFEETGVHVTLTNVSGIYQNHSRDITCIVFRGTYKSGTLQPEEGETSEVLFARLTEDNLSSFITREQFKVRVLDAMKTQTVPLNIYHVQPFQLLNRYGDNNK